MSQLVGIVEGVVVDVVSVIGLVEAVGPVAVEGVDRVVDRVVVIDVVIVVGDVVVEVVVDFVDVVTGVDVVD